MGEQRISVLFYLVILNERRTFPGLPSMFSCKESLASGAATSALSHTATVKLTEGMQNGGGVHRGQSCPIVLDRSF